ncbi:hypothetical protein Q5M48_01390 [Acinetobacter nosocomialis]|uniref:hypothetical protein n=1 Tax=Acinetobacter calcoaceticus/baumannii complex TaxID=909768 RepID=UPI0004514479|nr:MULTISPECIES: hypothetical protein [Acinetobacter calcoaceticus/baumannii complex]EXH22887.1 hypothetical protein J623_3707 [Acinetobacter sp. 1245249]MBR7723637.1 hypothetical protein [Acinetobacter nosocomialis]MDO7206845.1 hypothetical protein [Acinetobacter nosocomialis]
MDVCSFNWELASKFVPLVTPIISIGLAIFVYRIWHKQKGKEVIANEAKEFIIKLAELQSLQMEVISSIHKEHFNKEKFEKFKEVKKELSDSAVFIGFALCKNKKLSDLSTTVLSQAILFVENVHGWWNDGKLDNNRLIQASDAARLTEELLEYSLYKKSF